MEDNVDDDSMVAGKSGANMVAVDVVEAVPMDIQPDTISAELHLAADNAVVATAVAAADDYHHTVSSCANCSSRSDTCETDQSCRSADVTVDFRSGNVGIVADAAYHRVRHAGSHLCLGRHDHHHHVHHVGSVSVDNLAAHFRCCYCCRYRLFDVTACSHRRQLHWFQ